WVLTRAGLDTRKPVSGRSRRSAFWGTRCSRPAKRSAGSSGGVEPRLRFSLHTASTRICAHSRLLGGHPDPVHGGYLARPHAPSRIAPESEDRGRFPCYGNLLFQGN